MKKEDCGEKDHNVGADHAEDGGGRSSTCVPRRPGKGGLQDWRTRWLRGKLSSRLTP